MFRDLRNTGVKLLNYSFPTFDCMSDTITIAVLSDLHCHPSQHNPWESYLHSDALALPECINPSESLISLAKKRGIRADVLLVPGDITNRANKQGIVSGWQCLQRIAEALKVKSIAASLGNHDVDSRSEDDQADPFYLTKHLAKNFPIPNKRQQQTFWANGFCLLSKKDFCVLIINSVFEHHNEEEAKRGSITPHCLKELSSSLESINQPTRIALLHHHPLPHEVHGLGNDDLMKRGSLLLDLLYENNFQLVIHGHKHHPKLTHFFKGGRLLTVFGAGSFSATNTSGIFTNTRNLFHLIKLSNPVPQNCSNPGQIYSWEYHVANGWTEPNKTSADIPHVTGFGCLMTSEQLADEIEASFNTEKQPFLKWKTLLNKIPQLDFLTPQTFDQLVTYLKKKGIHILYDENHLPKQIGKENS